MYNYGHWSSTTPKPDNALSFLYVITFNDGTKYLGSKTMTNSKGISTKWENYNSSSKSVQSKLSYVQTREIVSFFDTREGASKVEYERIRDERLVESELWLNQQNLHARIGVAPSITPRKIQSKRKEKIVYKDRIVYKEVSKDRITQPDVGRVEERVVYVEVQEDIDPYDHWLIRGRRYISAEEAAIANNVAPFTIEWWCSDPRNDMCFRVKLR